MITSSFTHFTRSATSPLFAFISSLAPVQLLPISYCMDFMQLLHPSCVRLGWCSPDRVRLSCCFTIASAIAAVRPRLCPLRQQLSGRLSQIASTSPATPGLCPLAASAILEGSRLGPCNCPSLLCNLRRIRGSEVVVNYKKECNTWNIS